MDSFIVGDLLDGNGDVVVGDVAASARAVAMTRLVGLVLVLVRLGVLVLVLTARRGGRRRARRGFVAFGLLSTLLALLALALSIALVLDDGLEDDGGIGERFV